MLRYFTAHPTAANLLMLAFLLMGLFTVKELRRETFPDFAASKVQIVVPYPGAAPADVEHAVCGRIEDALDGIENLAELRCEALENQARAVVEMADGGDFQQFLDDIDSDIGAIADFPAQTEDPIFTTLGRTDAVVSIAITGPLRAADLKAYAEQFKDRLQQHTRVSKVEMMGFSQHQFRVELSAEALRRYGLSVAGVAAVIARQSVDLPAGSVETREREILLRFTDERRSPQQLADLVIVGNRGGAQLRLGDIATVRDTFEDEENKILFNGLRAAVLQVQKTPSEDTLTIFDAVRDFVENEQQRAPPDVRYTLTQNISSIVRDRLDMLMHNGVQGFILVAMTLWLFFSLRFAFWVVMGLPVSFMGALFFMRQMDYSLNMMTMVGLLIAIGLLMDDAIVLAENIASHRQRGKTALASAVDGTREVAGGVVSSFLTTLSMFGPLVFISGDIGKVLRVMPVVLILVLMVSLIEAFWILPHHLRQVLEHPPRPNRFRQGFESGLDWVRQKILGRAVDWAVDWRYAFIGGVAALFLVSLGMLAGGVVKFKAFPDIDGDVVEARILLPQGTPPARTEAVAQRLTDALAALNQDWKARQPGGQDLVQNLRVDFNKNQDANETGAHVATVSADLLTAEARNATIDEIISDWRARVGALPDVISLKYTEPAIGPAGLALEILISGDDLKQLEHAARDLKTWLGSYQGVHSLLDDLRPGKPELRLRLKDGAAALGLDAQNIAAQLRAAWFGQIAGEVQVGAEGYEVQVRLADSDRDSLADLDYFTVTTPAGAQVPLHTVADIESGRGYGRIQRIDGVRTVTVQGEVDTRVANVKEIVSHTRQNFLPRLQQTGVRVAFKGESKSGGETGGSIARAFLTGLLGIFILLSFQFRSYIEPLTVILAIPLALIGVVGGHLFMGLDLSMPSMMGFVSLSGIVVNDSILLITFLKLRAADPHTSVHEAAKLASRDRFRAVLLTSLTTIAGLLPLLAEKSLQAQVLIPLVTSLAFGLMASTLLVLLVVPALYTILEDWGLARPGAENGAGDQRAK